MGQKGFLSAHSSQPGPKWLASLAPCFFSSWAINGLQAYRKHLALGRLRANKL